MVDGFERRDATEALKLGRFVPFMGCRWSEVQILSPRLGKSRTYGVMP